MTSLFSRRSNGKGLVLTDFDRNRDSSPSGPVLKKGKYKYFVKNQYVLINKKNIKNIVRWFTVNFFAKVGTSKIPLSESYREPEAPEVLGN